MKWSEALRDVDVVERTPADAEVTSVAYDSRKVGAGTAFVAILGATTDGSRYIADALAHGVSAIVTDSRAAYTALVRDHPHVAAARVAHGRRALAQLSAAFFAHPERHLAISAVTGTNGKTTTAWLLESLLRHAGRSTLLLGTIETRIGTRVRPSEHTTPESRDLLELFAEGVRTGVSEVVMEMSSHALDQERVWGLPVDVAIFTNLTQDHLDYHGTMANYLKAKTRLFEGVGAAPPRVAVLNADDDAWSDLRSAARASQIMSYSCNDDYAEYRAESIEYGAGWTRFLFKTPCGDAKIESPLTGRVNVSNLLAASCAALARGLSLDQIAAAAPDLSQVPGRFQVVPGSAAAGFSVVVDYAHTDDALRNLIALARELVGARAGRVITLFGCGGDRDRTKRPRMGRAAAEDSDLVILTSDNPRTENPLAIIDEALAGVRLTTTQCIVEPDRAAAIRIAIRAAKPGDIVLLAGKGHEKVQTVGKMTIVFDDVAVAARELEAVA